MTFLDVIQLLYVGEALKSIYIKAINAVLIRMCIYKKVQGHDNKKDGEIAAMVDLQLVILTMYSPTKAELHHENILKC